MARAAGAGEPRWFRSFYVRITVTFVLFVVVLIVLQGLIDHVELGRRQLAGRSPNTVGAIVASDVASLLTQDGAADLNAHLEQEYASAQPLYAVLDDGRVASNQSGPLPEDERRYAQDLVTDPGAARARADPAIPMPIVTVPIQVNGALRGVVVLPPAAPPGPKPGTLGRLASLSGTALLVLLTIVAAVVVFEPARRRLAALGEAARRLGAGDLAARATVSGADEIGGLAATFNQMASDLSARDEALRVSDRLRRQMLADVSHELKTPLTAMRGYAETLRREDISLEPDARAHALEILERETLRLDRIVRDLLDLARLEDGAGGLDLRVFAIQRLFAHVVERHQREIEAGRVAVGLDVAPEADQILADPDRIEQVVENLVANALRHVNYGGAVDLVARVEEDDIVLTVANSGPGIPPDHLPHVFERFYKVDAARTDVGGSGLGLSISRAIVLRHGGTIDAESGGGRTRFTVRLPREPAAALAPRHSASTKR